MLRCCLCQSLGASPSDHDESSLKPLLDHAVIHNLQINPYAKTNILKIFTHCFPKIAGNYTIREIALSIEAGRNSHNNDSIKGEVSNVLANNTKNGPQRQATDLVENTEKRALIHKQRKCRGGRLAKIPIRIQCRKILEASCDKSQQRFQCSVCDEPVILRSGQRDGFEPGCAIAHVLSRHMDIKPFRCRHCDHTTNCRSSMASHVKAIHQAPDYRSIHFITKIDDHEKEICEMVETCFGKKQGKVSKNDSQTKIKITKQQNDTSLIAAKGNQSTKHDGKRNHTFGSSMIGAHCRRTIAPYSTQQHRFECGICSKYVILRSGPKARVNPYFVRQHAVCHMAIKLFRCRYCSAAKRTQSDMGHHLKNVHKLAASNSIHYVNEISLHEKEICEMITICFGKKDQLTPGTNNLPLAPISILAFCRKTIPPSYCKHQRRFECNVCHQILTLRTGPDPLLNPRYMLNHVIACHMDVQPYRCQYCDYTAKTDSVVGRHVRQTHKTVTVRSVHYVDNTEAYREEICELITKCFGRKTSGLNSKYGYRDNRINDSNDPAERTKQSDNCKGENSGIVQSPSLTHVAVLRHDATHGTSAR